MRDVTRELHYYIRRFRVDLTLKNANNSTYNEVKMIKKVNSFSSNVYT